MAAYFFTGTFYLQVYEAFICIGSILIWAGLLLSIIKNDMLTIVIASGTIALGLLGLDHQPCGECILRVFSRRRFYVYAVFLFPCFWCRHDSCRHKVREIQGMRAASAVKTMGVACQNCGAVVPANAAFCPNCGAKKPGAAIRAATAGLCTASTVCSTGPYAAACTASGAAQPAPEPEQPEKPEGKKCLNCGMELPFDAAFCGKCGSKQ